MELTLEEKYPGLLTEEALAAETMLKKMKGETRVDEYHRLAQAYSQIFIAAQERIKLANLVQIGENVKAARSRLIPSAPTSDSAPATKERKPASVNDTLGKPEPTEPLPAPNAIENEQNHGDDKVKSTD